MLKKWKWIRFSLKPQRDKWFRDLSSNQDDSNSTFAAVRSGHVLLQSFSLAAVTLHMDCLALCLQTLGGYLFDPLRKSCLNQI